MKITYDKIADAMYIYFKKAKIFKTVKMDDGFLVDTDEKGKTIGIEILGASSQIPKNHLVNRTFNAVAVTK